MTAIFALAGLTMSCGTVPAGTGAPYPPEFPAPRPPGAATAPITRSGAESVAGAGSLFEYQGPEISGYETRGEPPERGWTALVPVQRTPGQDGEDGGAAGKKGKASAAQGEARGPYRNAPRAGALRNRALPQVPRTPRPPHGQAPRTLEPPYGRVPAPPRQRVPAPPGEQVPAPRDRRVHEPRHSATPAPSPRRTASPPRNGHEPPRNPWGTTTRTPPRAQDRPPSPMGDPCAKFTDFRRYYCDRLMGGHGD
ncbi:hypothetical protein [Sphaerisporangium sp. NPDC051011]|uniref:hypothetical protein n=1 Tax=Sphaerisporangium sp. NPDC051011 TaxID=3155792 RepID=UPI0033FC0428